jgi:hypothetical protein
MTNQLREQAIRKVNSKIAARPEQYVFAVWEVAVEQHMLVLKLAEALSLSMLDTTYVEGVTPDDLQPAFQKRFAKIKAALAAIDQEKELTK